MSKPKTANRRRKQAPKKNNVAKIARNVVKKELAKNLEDKYQIRQLDSVGDYVADIGAAANSDNPIFYPLPDINQGIGVAERIGNELIPKSLQVSGYVYLNQAGDQPNFAYSQVTIVKIYVGLVRNIQSEYSSACLEKGQLLIDYDGTPTDFEPFGTTGVAPPIALDRLKMNYKYFKPVKTLSMTLGKNNGVLNGNNAPISAKYGLFHKFNINLTKHLPKKFIYNRDAQVTPQNFMPVIYACAFNATNGDLVARPQLVLKSILKYTDA